MKKIILALSVLMTSVSYVQAQEQAELSQLGCGTVTTPEEMQRIYEFNRLPAPLFKTTADADTIPLTIHLVGRDDGSGYYSMDHLFQVLCELNTRFEPVNMYFAIKWPVRYINNTSYYIHNNARGADMMLLNNVPNTVNVYFVDDPAGACGYYSPFRDAVAIGIKCSAPTSTTLTHELGHFFGLPHTFFGWEGGNTPPSIYQENVARSGAQANCATAGDGFCDTEADYIAERWNSCVFYPVHADQYGVTLTPDATVYMSYSPDRCMTRFTNQQIAFMRNNLYSRRTNLLNYLPKTTEAAPLVQPEIIYPADLLYANFQKVVWRKVPGAEYYHVKISRDNIFTFVFQEVLTADTSLELNFDVQNNAQLKVEVTPLKSGNVCGISKLTHPFTATDEHTMLDVQDMAASDLGSLVIAPNPVAGDQPIRLQLQSLPAGSYQLQLVSVSGQRVWQHVMEYYSGNQAISISTQSLPAGMYFLKATNASGGQWVEKLIIQP